MKQLSEIETLGIAGAGTMGQGIALVAALAGYEVLVYDPFEPVTAKAEAAILSYLDASVTKGKLTIEEQALVLGRIGFTNEVQAVVADLIIEAAPEQISLKHSLLRALQQANEPDTILATNTSTLPITQVAAGLENPAAVVGMHFFNPAPQMKLVEVIAGAASDKGAVATVLALAEALGKTAVRVADTPGFIVNRVARPYYLEALRILEEGGIEPETIDTLLENAGFKMGPIRLMDLIGIDTNHAVSQTLYGAFFQEPRFRPSRLQQQKVDAGHLGRKTGQGFYRYAKP
jgi:3-hydroxybutyryl-CoA dehydrogenase